jgi:hypothetical protein
MLNDKLLNILAFEQQYLLFSNTLPIFYTRNDKKENYDTVSTGVRGDLSSAMSFFPE